jgi:hypothetical protein
MTPRSCTGLRRPGRVDVGRGMGALLAAVAALAVTGVGLVDGSVAVAVLGVTAIGAGL